MRLRGCIISIHFSVTIGGQSGEEEVVELEAAAVVVVVWKRQIWLCLVGKSDSMLEWHFRKSTVCYKKAYYNPQQVALHLENW